MEVMAINEDVLRRLIKEHQSVIFSLCCRLVKDYFWAEDLCQEALLAAWRSWDNFDGKNERAWITRIATNKCLDHLKSCAERNLPLDMASMERTNGMQTAMSSEDEFFRSFIWDEVRRACADLPAKYRVIAEDHYIRGLKTAEIARKRDLTAKTVSDRLYKARQMLKNKLKEVG